MKNIRVYWQQQFGELAEGWYWREQDSSGRDIKTEKARGPFSTAVNASHDARQFVIDAARRSDVVVPLIPKRHARIASALKEMRMKTPRHVTADQINDLIDKNMLPANVIDEHPMAADLYRRFKAGSLTMTKGEAFKIGNMLDAMQHRIRELEASLAEARSQQQ